LTGIRRQLRRHRGGPVERQRSILLTDSGPDAPRNFSSTPEKSPARRRLAADIRAARACFRLTASARDLQCSQPVGNSKRKDGRFVMRKALMILFAASFLVVAFAPPASAQWSTRPIDKSMQLTFNGPVSLPGVTLPAGTYLFRFADPVNAAGVLAVLTEDGKTPLAMMHTIPIVRTETESNNSEIVTFRETPVEAAAAIDAWFFDAPETAIGSEDTGCELVYTK
jgi:hypothetical protein